MQQPRYQLTLSLTICAFLSSAAFAQEVEWYGQDDAPGILVALPDDDFDNVVNFYIDVIHQDGEGHGLKGKKLVEFYPEEQDTARAYYGDVGLGGSANAKWTYNDTMWKESHYEVTFTGALDEKQHIEVQATASVNGHATAAAYPIASYARAECAAWGKATAVYGQNGKANADAGGAVAVETKARQYTSGSGVTLPNGSGASSSGTSYVLLGGGERNTPISQSDPGAWVETRTLTCTMNCSAQGSTYAEKKGDETKADGEAVTTIRIRSKIITSQE
ncbi:MAG: hypothetical protein KDC95_04845 [Planctomycetes bacterium]|nr:hypothetical protein [Planctomycetota bacterium]